MTREEQIINFVTEKYKSLMYGKGNTPEGNGYLVAMGDVLRFVDKLPKEQEPQELDEALCLVNEYNLKPYRDGNAWCILLGKDIQNGICGFGYTLTETYLDFLKSYKEYNHPISELIAQISSPQGLDEAAEEYGRNTRYTEIPAFKAGAKWMAEQGQTWVCDIDRGRAVLNGVRLPFVIWDTYKDGDKVIVQIRKK